MHTAAVVIGWVLLAAGIIWAAAVALDRGLGDTGPASYGMPIVLVIAGAIALLALR